MRLLEIRTRALGVCAAVAVSALALTGCGDSLASDVGAGPVGEPVEPAVMACAQSSVLVSATLTSVTRVLNGSLGAPGAGPLLLAHSNRLQEAANATSDSVVQHALQDVVDSLQAFRVVIVDTSLGAYEDAVSDALGKLRGFTATCPVQTPGFEDGASGWAGATAATSLKVTTGGHSGVSALFLQNTSKKAASLGVMDSPRWVSRTVPASTYRVGLWARAEAAGATLTLEVTEVAPDGAVKGSRETARVLTATWSFLGMDFRPTSPGSSLQITASIPDANNATGVVLDDFAVARG